MSERARETDFAAVESPVASFRFLAGGSTELSTTSALDIGHNGRFISQFVLEGKVGSLILF
jgi:hypothetical protein